MNIATTDPTIIFILTLTGVAITGIIAIAIHDAIDRLAAWLRTRR